MRQKLFILPKLCSCNGDTEKQWFVYYSVRDPHTGKMVRFRHYDGFTGLPLRGREEHAKQLIEMFGARLRSGWTPFGDDTTAVYTDHLEYKTVAEMYGSKRAGNKTIRVWISKYLDTQEEAVRGTSFTTYKSKLRIFTLWMEKQGLGQNDLQTIDNKIICLFFRYLIDDRKLSGKSIKSYRQLIASAFSFFKKEKLIIYNPVYDLPICNRINDQAPRPIQRAHRKMLQKETSKDPELQLSIEFQYYCGMRPGKEIRLLKISDIDFFYGTIHIGRDTAKNTHDRIITIPVQFLKKLKEFYRLHEYNHNFYIFGRGGHPGIQAIGKNKLNYKFRKIREKLHLPKEYKHYSYKHTGAVDADEAGLPMKDISMHLGHGDIATTSIYFRNKKVGVSKAIRDRYPTL